MSLVIDNKLIKYKWPVLPRRGMGTAPWGYEISEDKELWVPIPEQLDAFELMKDFLAAGESLRKCADWLTEYTGRKISHQGIKKRIERDNAFYEGWESEPPEEITEWIVSEKDYGDGKLRYPREKPNAISVRTKPTRRQKIRAAKTPEEKQAIREAEKITHAKRTLATSAKKLKKLMVESEEVNDAMSDYSKEAIEVLTATPDAEEEDTSTEVIFKPNPGPQTDFLAASEDVVFYGGARGGGKSYALIADVLRYCGHPRFRALIFRRTTKELEDLILNTQRLYRKAFPGAKFLKTEKVWEFPSGARVEFGYAENEQDAERYRGQSFTYLGFDELPQFPDSSVFDMLMSSVRSVDTNLPIMIRCTGNPGNVGSGWVKEKFIDPATPNETFYWESEITDPRNGEKRVVRKSVRYIPATLFDNPYLVADDSYIASLASLPETKRKQMLEGNWDVVESGAFPEFDRTTHVIKPFEIPGPWLKFRAADWGYSSPFCVLWIAVDYDNNMYVYKEYYGQGVYDKDWALSIAKEEIRAKDFCEYGVIDGSVKSGGVGTIVEDSFTTINKVLRGHRLAPFRTADKGPGSRKEGKLAVHRALAPKETGRHNEDGTPETSPSLFIFNNCVNLIRTLPQLICDPNNPEVVLKKNADDHCFDALQYGIRSYKNNRSLRNAASSQTINAPKVADPVFGY